MQNQNFCLLLWIAKKLNIFQHFDKKIYTKEDIILDFNKYFPKLRGGYSEDVRSFTRCKCLHRRIKLYRRLTQVHNVAPLLYCVCCSFRIRLNW